jgi:GntR family transcriptional regulator, transcriptional repressor for pyruvate dehydrogenase complex
VNKKKGKHNIRVIKTQSLRSQVYEKLKEQIMKGIWEEGERLPSESEMCEMFGVSRVTIRGAIQQLEIQGLLDVIQGGGAFVKSVSTMKTVDTFNSLLTGQTEQDLVVILEYRKIVEKGTVGLAQQKITRQDIRDLESIYKDMVDSRDIDDYIRADWAFHLKIAEIARNSVILKVYDFLHGILSIALAEELNMLGRHWGLKHHRAIIDAMEAGEKRKCENLMERHLDVTMQEILKRQKDGAGETEVV